MCLLNLFIGAQGIKSIFKSYLLIVGDRRVLDTGNRLFSIEILDELFHTCNALRRLTQATYCTRSLLNMSCGYRYLISGKKNKQQHKGHCLSLSIALLVVSLLVKSFRPVIDKLLSENFKRIRRIPCPSWQRNWHQVVPHSRTINKFT